jgi:hypothetical protein
MKLYFDEAYSIDSSWQWLLNVAVSEGLLLAVTLVLAFFFAEEKKGALSASIKILKDVVHHLAASVSIKVKDCSSLVYKYLNMILWKSAMWLLLFMM